MSTSTACKCAVAGMPLYSLRPCSERAAAACHRGQASWNSMPASSSTCTYTSMSTSTACNCAFAGMPVYSLRHCSERAAAACHRGQASWNSMPASSSTCTYTSMSTSTACNCAFAGMPVYSLRHCSERAAAAGHRVRLRQFLEAIVPVGVPFWPKCSIRKRFRDSGCRTTAHAKL